MNYQNSERNLSVVPVYATRAELDAALHDKQIFEMTTRHIPNVSVPLSGDVGSFGSLRIEVFNARDQLVVDLGEPNFGVGVITGVNGTTNPEWVFNTFPELATPLPIPAGGFYYWRITELVNDERVYFAGWFRVHDLEALKPPTPPTGINGSYTVESGAQYDGVRVIDSLGGIPNKSSIWWQWQSGADGRWFDWLGSNANAMVVSGADAYNRQNAFGGNGVWRRGLGHTDGDGFEWLGWDYFNFDGTDLVADGQPIFWEPLNPTAVPSGKSCENLVQWRVFPQSTIPSDFRGGGVMNTDGFSMSYIGRAVLDFPIIEENVTETENGLGFRTTIARSVRKRQQLVFQMVPDHAVFPMQLMLSEYWSPTVTNAVNQLKWLKSDKIVNIAEPTITIEPSTNGLVATVRMIFTSEQVFQHWGENPFPSNPVSGSTRVSPNLPFITQNQP